MAPLSSPATAKIRGKIFRVFLAPLLSLLAACTADIPDAGCVACHNRLEAVSPSHPGCTSCHGGDPKARSAKAAHAGMLGPQNPSDPGSAAKSCGTCHPYQLGRVDSTIMNTAAGMIRNIQLTWEGEDGRSYSARGGKVFGPRGNPQQLE